MWLSNARFPTYKEAGCAMPHLYSERSARQAHPSAGVSNGGGLHLACACFCTALELRMLLCFKNRDECVTETLCRPNSPRWPCLTGLCEGHHSAGWGLAQRKQAIRSGACNRAISVSKQTAS